MKKKLVIAIDGPSASGKGTLAKKIAAHFGLACLNTGAIYRLIALRIIEQRIDPQNFDHKIFALTKNISESDLENEKLFSENVGEIASLIAKNPKLRAAIFDFQRDFVECGKREKNGCVLEGRDTTTVICPDANYKFFITATVEIRAKRRFEQLKNVPYEEILSQLKKRDENDLNRKDSPLKIAPNAIIIDNGNFSVEESVNKILSFINF
ncbi:MAG: cytidylate kinase [Alphaproteobacteria bacterium RIFCSPLOWO2_01_FULL_40_26]|nr:MAG: cytidylate kinase [Alphaproteobacteria bacterium RIFCSPHIGHO2_02_FULL_40_34]OFW86311.1 MAG: cytidylate kinase [Alphaproteobacteria bacterium RIFCSPHIGHO2_01_FULL_40_8]OFW95170.1 MAG: cytidylate kinase [Alphaproteobacteria bacterium RIFCSPLOWO2_01_FULL_40_26]OFX09120.1 MAG: cytidylate kinase [Alphaproteobacteria bacterium RIFCSPLOWO2_02_FULL_40_19]OFX11495.1 MAG: cytidylate kinase [Alphaproteobacteria bacterium RIFCSPLOWO2_12_FULL_40_11]